VQNNLKRFGDWNETVKYSQRCAARLELRRRARTAAVQVDNFIEELSSAVTDLRVNRVLPAHYIGHNELNGGARDEDSEITEFMSLVSAVSAESQLSAQGSVLRSSRSDISESSSLSGSKRTLAGKKHSMGFDSKTTASPKEQLAQRRLSLYLQSGDPFRTSSSNLMDQSAKLRNRPVKLAQCEIVSCSTASDHMDACAGSEVEGKPWRKQHILIYSTVFVLASVAIAKLLIFVLQG